MVEVAFKWFFLLNYAIAFFWAHLAKHFILFYKLIILKKRFLLNSQIKIPFLIFNKKKKLDHFKVLFKCLIYIFFVISTIKLIKKLNIHQFLRSLRETGTNRHQKALSMPIYWSKPKKSYRIGNQHKILNPKYKKGIQKSINFQIFKKF